MDNELKMEDFYDNALPSEAQETDLTVENTQESNQDPMVEELERVKAKKKFTKEEQIEYNIQRMQKELQQLRGISEDIDEDDRPVTLKMLKEMQNAQQSKSALELANNIQNPVERELVQYHIENSIKPSGDAETDLRNARVLANAVRNNKIIEEQSRKPMTQSYSGASSAPMRAPAPVLELTKEELQLKQWGGLTDEEVIKATRKL